MALATRCPKCQSLFRVVADQLKLRGGLVRCGSCRHVFDAIGSLTHVDDSAVLSQSSAATSAPAIAASSAAIGAPNVTPNAAANAASSSATGEASSAPSSAAASAPPRERPALSERRIEPGRRYDMDRAASEAGVPTLILTAPIEDDAMESDLHTDIQAAPAEGGQQASTADPGGHNADDPERQARRERRRRRKLEAERKAEAQRTRAGAEEASDDDEDEQAPEFLQGRQQSGGFSIVFGGGSAVMLALMLLQLAVIFRIELSTQFPALRPTLVQLCKPFSCNVGWPTRAELLAVMGTELQAVPGTDILELTAVIRNRAGFGVALPALEVTLTDTQNRDVARKVFAPVDYLASSGQPSSRIQEGLAGGADYEVRIHFEARGLSAAGYRVYPFYL